VSIICKETVLHGRDKQSRERSCDLTFNTVAARFADFGVGANSLRSNNAPP